MKEDPHAYRTSGCFDMKKLRKELDDLRIKLNYNRELEITEVNFNNKPIAVPIKKLENIKQTNKSIGDTIKQSNTKKLNFRNLL